jgi:hypothetical protein
MQKRGKIEKFCAYKAQRLKAILLWNPNGRLGSDGGGQGSYEFWGRRQTNPRQTSPCPSVPKKSVSISVYVNPRLKSLYFLYTLWPQNPTNKTPKDHLFSPLLSFTLPRLSPFVLRSSSLLPKSRSAKKVFKTCSKPVHFLQKVAKSC